MSIVQLVVGRPHSRHNNASANSLSKCHKYFSNADGSNTYSFTFRLCHFFLTSSSGKMCIENSKTFAVNRTEFAPGISDFLIQRLRIYISPLFPVNNTHWCISYRQWVCHHWRFMHVNWQSRPLHNALAHSNRNRSLLHCTSRFSLFSIRTYTTRNIIKINNFRCCCCWLSSQTQ